MEEVSANVWRILNLLVWFNIGKKLTRTDVDIIFAKSKTKGKRVITLAEFEVALGHVATKMNIPVEKVKAKVLKCSGPNFVGTKVRFFL